MGGAAGPRDGAGQQHRDHDRGVRGEARRHDQRLPGERGGAAAAGAGHRDHVLPAPAGPGRGRGGDRPREYRVELQTKVKRRFAKISQSLRKPLLQPGEGPSRSLHRDYEPSCGPSFQALGETDLRHLEVVQLAVQRHVHVVPDEVAALAAAAEGDALLRDVDGLGAGLGLAVHADLEVVHAGDFFLELSQLGVEFSSPELDISNPELELLIDLQDTLEGNKREVTSLVTRLGLIFINADLGVLNESFGLLQQPLSGEALRLGSSKDKDYSNSFFSFSPHRWKVF